MSGLSPESLALLARARRGEGPPPGAREAGKRRLSLTLGAAAAGTALSAAGAAAAPDAAAFTLKSALVYLAVGAVSGSLVSGISVAVRSASPSSALPSPHEREVPAPVVTAPALAISKRGHDAASTTAPGRARSREAANATSSPREVAREVATSAPALPRETATARVSRSDPSELSGLVAAQSALRAGDANLALGRLEEHRRRFPHSQFEEERSAARIVAVCALGRASEGRALLDAFRQRFPASPATPRVTAACR